MINLLINWMVVVGSSFAAVILIGGLFLPRPTPVSPYGPIYTTPVVPYVQPLPYVNEIPSYSVPVTNSTIK